MALSPRKQREREARKTDIIEAAREVFYEKGFVDATMEEIAQKADFSKGAIYFYFKSKEEILLHINCAYMDQFREALEALQSSGDRPEKIIQVLLGNVKVIFREFISRLDSAVYFTPGNQPLNVPKPLEERWNRSLTGILKIFADLMDHSPTAAQRERTDSLQYALFILSMGLGVFLLSKSRSDMLKEIVDTEAQFDILGEVLKKALLRGE